MLLAVDSVSVVDPAQPGRKAQLFLARRDDVARVEDRTFICHVSDAEPTNNWVAPTEMKQVITDLYRGYVVPF
jgi:phosphoenolpyruvate carboxykinase (GTP)